MRDCLGVGDGLRRIGSGGLVRGAIVVESFP